MATTAEHAASITARIDRLPECLAVWLPIVLVSAVGIFEVYDLYETAYLPIGLARAGIFKMGSQGLFGLTDQATFAAATFLGLFLGAIGFSSAADKHGRRVVFLWALAAYSTASFLMALQSSALGVHLMRLLAGVGIGVELVTLDAYLVEIVPKAFRGKAFAVSHFVSLPPQPLEHRPRSCEVLFVIFQDFAHQVLPLHLVAGFRRLDERRHRPLSTELALTAFEPNVLLDDFEAETRHEQDDGIFRHS